MAGKTWFITGASRGFGRIWAEAALARGDKVAATARTLADVADLRERFGDAVLPMALDVTDSGQVQQAVGQAHAHFGRLDVVLNNAGYTLIGTVEEASEAEVRALFDTNYFGALRVIQAALPLLRQQGSGHIVGVSSGLGILAMPLIGFYCATKWALEALHESLAPEVKALRHQGDAARAGRYLTGFSGPESRKMAAGLERLCRCPPARLRPSHERRARRPASDGGRRPEDRGRGRAAPAGHPRQRDLARRPRRLCRPPGHLDGVGGGLQRGAGRVARGSRRTVLAGRHCRTFTNRPRHRRRSLMRVFVTGATGFIGSAVVADLINAGHQVLGLSRSDRGAEALAAAGAEVHRGDLEDLDSLRRGCGGGGRGDPPRLRPRLLAVPGGLRDRPPRHRGDGRRARRLGPPPGRHLRAVPHPGERRDGGCRGPRELPDSSRLRADGAPFAARGVRVSAMRLPQVHDTRKQGLVTFLIAIAREKGVSAYVGDGLNRWPAIHVLDAAPLYRLALEKGSAGASYHAVAEEGVPLREIAEAIGRGLKVPVDLQVPGGGRRSLRPARVLRRGGRPGVERPDAGEAGMASDPEAGLIEDLDHMNWSAA